MTIHGRGNAALANTALRGCRRTATGPADLVIEAARSTAALDALGDDWAALYERLGERNPFLSFEWTRACFEATCGSLKPYVVTARHRGKLVGVAPLCIETRRGFRTLRFIGEDRSDYLGMLCDPQQPGLERRLMAALVAGTEWDLIVLRRLAAPFTTLHNAEYRAAARWHRTQWTTSAFGGSGRNWESLHTEGPSWFSRMRKECRRFERQGGRVERFTGENAAAHMETVAAIEAASWKGLSGIQRLGSGPGQHLLRNAFSRMSQDIELWLATVEGKPVAFQINLLTPERLFLYQGAFDEAFRKSGAGSVLDYLSIEHAWQRGVREYDYLGGDEAYKAQRTSDVRTIFNMAGHARTARGWLAYATLLAPRWKLRRSATLKLIRSKSKRLRSTLASIPRMLKSRSLALNAASR